MSCWRGGRSLGYLWEKWLEECSSKIVDFSIRVKDYWQSNAINVQEKDEEHTPTGHWQHACNFADRAKDAKRRLKRLGRSCLRSEIGSVHDKFAKMDG